MTQTQASSIARVTVRPHTNSLLFHLGLLTTQRYKQSSVRLDNSPNHGPPPLSHPVRVLPLTRPAPVDISHVHSLSHSQRAGMLLNSVYGSSGIYSRQCACVRVSVCVRVSISIVSVVRLCMCVRACPYLYECVYACALVCVC